MFGTQVQLASFLQTSHVVKNERTARNYVARLQAMGGKLDALTAYKVGQLKILELRDRARTALGPKFNLKDSHTVVLESGAVPLTVLEQLVDEWIATGSHSA